MILAAVAAVGAGALWVMPAGAAPRPGITLGPSVTIMAPVVNTGSPSTGFVRLTTGKKATAFENPVTFDNTEFTDSPLGSCWGDYLANGRLIPKNTTCLIAVRFSAAASGERSATMTVRECRVTTVDDDGRVRCASIAGSVSLTVNGIGTDPPDLVPTAVTRSGTSDYTVTIANNGSGRAGDTVAQGYWSVDPIFHPTDSPACGSTLLGPIEPGTTNNSLFVGCSIGPSAGEDYLIVELDPGQVVGESDDGNNMFVLWLNPVT